MADYPQADVAQSRFGKIPFEARTDCTKELSTFGPRTRGHSLEHRRGCCALRSKLKWGRQDTLTDYGKGLKDGHRYDRRFRPAFLARVESSRIRRMSSQHLGEGKRRPGWLSESIKML